MSADYKSPNLISLEMTLVQTLDFGNIFSILLHTRVCCIDCDILKI